jgi:hypothetical protein
MHGIVLAKVSGEGSEARYAHIPRIVVRYADRRDVVFVPEARRRFFNEDDALKLAEILEKASQIAEFSWMSEGVGGRFAR